MTPENEFTARTDGSTRRGFLGYLFAAPTLLVAAEIGDAMLAPPAAAVGGIPTVPQPSEIFDGVDLIVQASKPTANLIAVQINEDGTASFALPRTEVGQGITTSTAMLIAEELELPLDRVHVGLANARPELLFNQLTGGSTTTASTYTPIRVAAAIARDRLLRAASIELGESASNLAAKGGEIVSTVSSRALTYGDLAAKAASLSAEVVEVTLKPRSQFTVIGTPQGRIDARAAVTGTKQFTLDLSVPDAKPVMVCRPPTINGTVRAVHNAAEVEAMPGITDVVEIPTGVAVRAETFGQCIDGVRALQVDWAPGTAEGKSDESVLGELRRAELPMAIPDAPLLAETINGDFTFHFASPAGLEPMCAVADVRSDRAEVWAPLKAPIVTQEALAKELGLPVSSVTVHVTEAGGSFGRKLWPDGALEAVQVSKATGKPAKLIWHRVDECRAGRSHPMCTTRVRAAVLGGNVLSFELRHTSVATDFGHGLGDVITSMAAQLPVADLGFSATAFQLSQLVPYNFGVVNQLLNEVDSGINTTSMRNVWSPDVCCAREVMTDRIAEKLRKDPYEFRRAFLKDDRFRAVLDKVAQAGDWGRHMAPGTAQGIAFHAEFKGCSAALVEIDCRPETVDRDVRDGVAGPRVTKAVFAVDVGLPVNPRGLEAQMMGGIMDGIALAFTSSLHLKEGRFLEGSWDNYFYTRQWNVPPELEIHVMPPTTGEPGGAGEFAVAASKAAVACAFGRATGHMPTSFPINHANLGFEPKLAVPPIPASPTDGLDHTF